ncbi:PAS domain S-box-containing protein [Acetoanaerobium noterae]|uniref:PAS domain S-box-containing protein n=1 Tax=Acetoanaerobium noterae TaxID=745369 RepID=A0A1T5DD57_9FIRM|nr:sigma-54 dependent transcriptional regulator PrdR [Acetoanaerobium noterae]SKB69541.1 PAS domain S-box-containing protein [Acetoanaerobium noterae]
MFFNQTKRLKVKDIMSKDFIVFDSDISLRRCVEHIALNNLKEVIVRHHEKLTGYIKFDDIIKISLSQSFPEKKLFDIRANKPFYLNVEDTVLMAKDIMRENQVDRVFILDDEKLVGVLRTQDIVYKLYPKIQANEDLYELLWDNVHEGICIIDNKGTVCIWGRGSEKLYGIKKSEIIGKKLEEFFPTALLLDVLKSKEPVENIIHSPRKNTYVNISALPLIKNGKLIGVVSTERDVSEITNLSRELEFTKEKLDYLQVEVRKMNEDKFSFGNIVGKSKIMTHTIDRAYQVASTTSSVLISGESGTGKEVFARAIHQSSGREGAFVAINCSAIPESLFESEMFGYESGAFTGALSKGKIGKIEIANGGTLFLDEIGDMPLHMQAKLLRVLQERQLMRVGGDKSISLDVRVISATHRNLEDMVKAGTFREDLYYRLNVVNIKLPSLSDRIEDVPLFVKLFIEEFCRENHMKVPDISPEILNMLMNYSWPGNIRELKNMVEHLVVFSKNNEIQIDTLPEYINNKDDKTINIKNEKSLTDLIRKTEIKAIHDAMKECGNNKQQAAKLLDIPRSTLYYKIKFYDLNQYL